MEELIIENCIYTVYINYESLEHDFKWVRSLVNLQ